MDEVRTRYAPSPTGPLHVGTARTALFSYLFAKNRGGKFILRIEDTDFERSSPKYEHDIYEGLEWLKITADESPERGGEYGPYRQSERVKKNVYKTYLLDLLQKGKLFACFCRETERESDTNRLHWCDCHNRKFSQNENDSFVIRYRNEKFISFMTDLQNRVNAAGRKTDVYPSTSQTDASDYITFNDGVRGEISFVRQTLGNFIVAKNLKEVLYNFAVVVDDHEMKITDVIRGEDHISNTPKQLLIAEALGWAETNETGVMIPPWKYAHLPLILGPDRSKLSKRHGATSVSEYKEMGYLPEALFNFLALIGWNPGNEREILSKSELIEAFSLEHVQKSGAVFNVEKLDWMNGEYIRRKSPSELTALAMPYIADFLQFQIPNDKFLIAYIEKVITLEQPRLKKLSEIGARTDYFFREPDCSPEFLKWKKMTPDAVRDSLTRSKTIIENIMTEDFAKEKLQEEFMKEIGEGDKGELLWPLRVALSGKKASPGPFEIMEILGKEESAQRVNKALAMVATKHTPST